LRIRDEDKLNVAEYSGKGVGFFLIIIFIKVGMSGMKDNELNKSGNEK